MLYRFAMLVCRLLFAVLRTHRTAIGQENIPDSGGAVLAITHFGYLEFALVAYTIWRHDRRRARFLATASAFKNPIVGFLLTRLGQIPVDRRAGAGAYHAAVAALEAGSLVGIFPEAGIDPSFTVRPLKTGAARLASEGNAPLVPVALWGGQRLMTREHTFRFRERFGVPVRLAFAPPLSTEGERHEVSARLRASMQQLVTELQRDYPDAGEGQWWHPAHLGGTAPTPEKAAELDEAVVARRAARYAAQDAKRARKRG
ncbi:MAG TPA: lysophospholipid acyltransferase family protein [Galbitalea sp.]|jgi:1-acyl-sn-glycerol-3-phosphate acyltransferase|nr:lysophospholipid acyltransferase family protein [Galbitalea sp.]